MTNIVEYILDGVDVFLAWASSALKTTTESYCELQTADSPTVLVGNDGALVSVLKIEGVKALIGREEFNRIQDGMRRSLQTSMAHQGQAIQVYFAYNRDEVGEEIANIFEPARETAKRLHLSLDDLFSERMSYLAQYCAREDVFIVLWTRPNALTGEQFNRAVKEKQKAIKKNHIPPFRFTQNLIAAIHDLRDVHDSFVRAVRNDMLSLGIVVSLLEVHQAVYEMRRSIDPDFTDRNWRPALPGDRITIKEPKKYTGDVSDILWPSLGRQIIPRDAMNLDLRTVRVGDRIFSCVFIDLFPKEIQPFSDLLLRILPMHIPWRISFLVEGGGLDALKLKSALTSVLSWTSAQNRLINDSVNLLRYINLHADDAVVKLRVAVTTWAPEGDIRTLRTRASQLAKAVEGWGSCDVSEVSGDAFGGYISASLGVSCSSVATATVAPLSSVLFMLPLFRPSSPWKNGAILFRSPDGKPWPYQPGSSEQTTWIDLFYARPGSGKSVLSNAINLALCLASGIQRLPRIAIVDIGPSSSGLISLLKEALPYDQRHFVAYHRMRMTPEYSINPFDTQLGCRYPTPQERSFLVNFITLLATPIGAERPYDGIADMAGMIVDELYKRSADDGNPNTYASGTEEMIDGILEEIGFVKDIHTTWWEVTDALFLAGFVHEAMLAQRHASPLIADSTAICRTPAVEDLYGKIIAPTGESLINAFSRMISAAVREYPILSQPTRFDLGETKIVSLDLDEVAKSGGDAANRQTAVMYMLARYALARHYYLTDENLSDMTAAYRSYHERRIAEIKEDPKRLVFDEFHRTAKTSAVREQVIVDMREGRKWKVQVALISQSIEDFDSVMIEFATSIFIMDAGPEQAIRKTTETFGLSETAQTALRSSVHGPREGGATFLAQFATKEGMNTQLLTSTLGPVELWAFNTTAEDSNIRNQLYLKIGPAEARRVLATLFPGGSAVKAIENRLTVIKERGGLIDEESKLGVIDQIVKEVLEGYSQNPDFKQLPSFG
ncbi:MAG: type IV secretion protein IcmB [Gammaproteobacteria bacterium]|nr:type IV secretion protein IcmB [Gammaproteobacteria bacterium]